MINKQIFTVLKSNYQGTILKDNNGDSTVIDTDDLFDHLLIEDIYTESYTDKQHESLDLPFMITPLNTRKWHQPAIDVSKSMIHPGNTNATVYDIIHPCMYLYPSSLVPKHKTEPKNRFGLPYITPNSKHGELHQWISHPITNGKLVDPHQSIAFYTPQINTLLQNALPLWNNIYGFTQIYPHLSINDIDEQAYIEDDDIHDMLKSCKESLPVSELPSKLKVYIKYVNMNVNNGDYHQGVWHVEGMP